MAKYKFYDCINRKESEVKIVERCNQEVLFRAYFKNQTYGENTFKNWQNFHYPYSQVFVDFYLKIKNRWNWVATKKVPGYKKVTVTSS